MDVNKPEAVHAVGDSPHRRPQERHEEHASDDDEAARRERYKSWSSDEAVDLDGALVDSLTPEVQKLLNTFAAQIEPLRQQLEQAVGQANHYRELATGHPFLPLPNRREFLRELNHVIAHRDSLSPRAALMVIHVKGIGVLRRRFGRATADKALIYVAETISDAIHPTDAAGSLCGDDFGVILLNGDAATAARRVADIRDRLARAPFSGAGEAAQLDIAVGVAVLGENWTPERALEAADRDMLSSSAPA